MENTSGNQLSVVLGGGQIGDRIASMLAARGEQVRVVQRTARASGHPNIARVAGDITDRAFAEQAIAGASVVYDCMNPQYHQWQEWLLPMGRGALHGAAKAGARLVALDCLYMYGAPDGPMREDSPRSPCSKKGELRVQLEALRLRAEHEGDVRVAIGRASDFFGSNLPNSLFGARFWQRLLADKPVECIGDPDQPHSYNYADDVARGLVTLGDHPEAFGQVWHLPAVSSESTRALFERVARELGQRVRVRTLPQWIWDTAGLVSPFMRAGAEMTYQWKMPYVLDSSRFEQAFGQAATPIDQAVRETAAWALSVHGKQRAA